MLTEAEPRPVLAAVSDDPHSATATHAPSAPLRGHRPADPTAFDEPAPPNAIRSWFHPGAKIHEDSGAKTLDDTHGWGLRDELPGLSWHHLRAGNHQCLRGCPSRLLLSGTRGQYLPSGSADRRGQAGNDPVCADALASAGQQQG